MALLDDGSMGNFLSQLLTSTGEMRPGFMTPSQPRPAYNNVFNPGSQSANPYQPRSSIVNGLGAFADAFAELGGETGGYQPRLDAAWDRQRTAESDQMARDEFGLKRQKYGLDLDNARFEQLQEQNKVLGNASSILRHAFSTGGAQQLGNIWGKLEGRLGFTPEQRQQLAAQLAEDPEGFVGTMEALAKAGGGDSEFYGTQYYETDDQGNVYPYIIGKDGSKRYIAAGDGRRAAPKLSIENTGLAFQGINPFTGQANGPTTPITAIPNQGVTVTQGPEGPTFNPIQGGEADNKVTEEVRNLQALDSALGSFESIFPEVRGNIDTMAAEGSLSGVPEGATYAADPTKPLRGGSNVGAVIQQNVPFVEQVFNDKGFSARQQIESAGRTMVQSLGPLLTQAQNSGANLTSRMMDTPKELEGLLAQAINTKDYGAAVAAYNRFQTRYNEVRREVREKIKAAQARTAQGRRQQPSAPAAAPNRIRYDAQGNRIQ